MPADHPHHVALWLAEVFGGPDAYSDEPRRLRAHDRASTSAAATEEQRARWASCSSAGRRRGRTSRPIPSSAPPSSAYVEWGTRIACAQLQPGADPPPQAPRAPLGLGRGAARRVGRGRALSSREWMRPATPRSAPGWPTSAPGSPGCAPGSPPRRSPSPWASSSPSSPTHHRWPYEVLGFGYALLGAALVLYGFWRRREVDEAVEAGRYASPHPRAMAVFAIVATVLGAGSAALIQPDKFSQVRELARFGGGPAAGRSVTVRQRGEGGVQARAVAARESREHVDALERVAVDAVVLARAAAVFDVDRVGRADRLVARRVAAAGGGVVGVAARSGRDRGARSARRIASATHAVRAGAGRGSVRRPRGRGCPGELDERGVEVDVLRDPAGRAAGRHSGAGRDQRHSMSVSKAVILPGRRWCSPMW